MKKKQNIQGEEEFVDTGKILTEEDLMEDEKEQKQDISKESEYLEMAQRIQAEFDNYRRRNQDAQKNAKQDGIIHAVEMLLPVVDSINSAKRQITEPEFLKSIELVYEQTLSCFKNLGVQKIDAINMPFNPEFHNAIMAEEVDGVEPDMVIDEFQEGFEINGKVIRHSVVKVSK